MHELPVTEGLLDVVLESAERHGAKRVVAVDLVIGDLSSIVDDSVQFYFDILSKGTLAEGAELRFSRLPASATCLECGWSDTVQAPLTPWCPSCGGARLRIEGGREFTISSIEVEDEDPGGHGDIERQ